MTARQEAVEHIDVTAAMHDAPIGRSIALNLLTDEPMTEASQL